MKFDDVTDEIAARLAKTGLREFAYVPDAVSPPAAIVLFPDRITFDATYGRGMDTMEIPVWVVVGKPHDRSTRSNLAGYCGGSGPTSVKAAVESAGYASCDSVRVVSADFEIVTIGGTDFMSARFTLDVSGSGAE